MSNSIGFLDPKTFSFRPHDPDTQEGAVCVVRILRWLDASRAVVTNDVARAASTAVEVVLESGLVFVLKQDGVPSYHRIPETLTRPEDEAERHLWVEALARRHGYRWAGDFEKAAAE